ncbi:MAG: glycosyltransferase family 4 protein [Spirochaetes bacterium]|nr:glycosyltransferase family 4 protein [Spirochaetota bacterium]
MKNKKIAMIVFSNYPEDPRVRREAEALSEKGHSIDIFCLKKQDQQQFEVVNEINVYRSSMSKKRTNKFSHILKYSLFMLGMFFKISVKYIKNKYDIIHIHNMPDILVFIALLPKLFGAKVILDLHDPTPEVYMAKYNIDYKHRMVKFLMFLEKVCIAFAHHIITPNSAFKELFVTRSCKNEKIDIIMNSPNEKIFKKKDAVKSSDGYHLIYHGSVVERHGLTEALLAVKDLKDKIPNLRFDIYGGGDYEDQLLKEIEEFEVSNAVFFHGYETQENLVEKIQQADLGLIPNRRNPFTEINLPTRIFEYLCLNKPVIVPKTKGIFDYFDEQSLFYFEAGNAGDLAKRIYSIYQNPKEINEVLKSGINIYKKYTWEIQKLKLIEIVNKL